MPLCPRPSRLLAAFCIASPLAIAQPQPLPPARREPRQPGPPITTTLPLHANAASFELNDSVARDKRTGLTWTRCSVGQDWMKADQSCAGVANLFTREEATRHTPPESPWRLPSASELFTALNGACTPLDSPATRSVVFAGIMPNHLYMTSSVQDATDRSMVVRGCFASFPIDTGAMQRGPLLLVRKK